MGVMEWQQNEASIHACCLISPYLWKMQPTRFGLVVCMVLLKIPWRSYGNWDVDPLKVAAMGMLVHGVVVFKVAAFFICRLFLLKIGLCALWLSPKWQPVAFSQLWFFFFKAVCLLHPYQHGSPRVNPLVMRIVYIFSKLCAEFF